MQWMNGVEWDFVEMTKRGAVLPPEDVKAKIVRAQQMGVEKRAHTLGSRVDYWNHTAPGGYFEHWHFEQGWDLGFSDARTFFGTRMNGGVGGAQSGDSIAALEVWVMKR